MSSQPPFWYPEVVNLQDWQNMVDAADRASMFGRPRRQQQQQQQQQQHLLEAAIHTPLPMGTVSVIKEVVVDTQPATIEPQRSASIVGLRQPFVTTETQQPTTIIEATKQQTPASPNVSHTVIKDQLKAARKASVSSITPEQHLDVVVQAGAISEQPPAPKRKSSLRRTFGRTKSRLSSAFLAALRVGADESLAPDQTSAEEVMIKWKALVSEREQQEQTMEGAYDSFQDMIEEAMDSKYKELKGEGRFLIYEESVELPAKVPTELPVEEREPTAPKQEESTWVAHWKKEEEITEFHYPYTSSIKRPCLPFESPRVSGEHLVCRPAKPRTYSPRPPSPAQVAEPKEPEPVVDDQHGSTPSPADGSRLVESGTEMDDDRPKTLSPPRNRESRLPRPASRVRDNPALGNRASSVQPSAAQSAEASKSHAPSKGRKDSAQPGASQSAQTKDRYPRMRHLSKK